MIIAYGKQTCIFLAQWTVLVALLLQWQQPQRFFMARAAAPSSSAFIANTGRACAGGKRAFLELHNSYRSPRRGELSIPSIDTLLFQSRDWIDEVDDDDEDDYLEDSVDALPVAPDMKYLPRNVLRQNQNFVAIREAGGKELTNDIYVREPPKQSKKDGEDDDDDDERESTFYFVGKVARISDVTPQQAIQRQWNIIETHAAHLRPIELFPARGSIEIYMAPGDSEMEVAYNRPDLIMERIPRITQESERKALLKFKSTLMGFQGEVYDGGEEGFRTWRFSDGRPSRKEIQSPNQDELQTPTDEEMAKIQQELEGKDLNALYEEQQRREGKPIED